MLLITKLKNEFDSCVTKNENGCLVWRYYKDPKGRAVVMDEQNKCQRASRVTYSHYIWEVPDDLCVLHACDNPACLNLKHLFLGTQQDNMRDKKLKGRQDSNQRINTPRKTHCKHGHEKTPLNTSRVGSCLICRRKTK